MAKPWTKAEVEALKRMIGEKTNIDVIATALHRPINAIYLKAYREHIPMKPQHHRPLMRLMMQAKFRDITLFQANRDFYIAVNISQKRWPDLLYGYECPTPEEIKSVARYLNFEPYEYEKFIQNKQLELFE